MRTSSKIIRVCLILIAFLVVAMCVVAFWFYDIPSIKNAIINFAQNLFSSPNDGGEPGNYIN